VLEFVGDCPHGGPELAVRALLRSAYMKSRRKSPIADLSWIVAAAAVAACGAPNVAPYASGDGALVTKQPKTNEAPKDPPPAKANAGAPTPPAKPSTADPKQQVKRACMDRCVGDDPDAKALMDAEDLCREQCNGDQACRDRCADAAGKACDASPTACDKLDTCDPKCFAPTFTEIYESFLGPNTPGHCGDCHASIVGGFQSGTLQDDCYAGLVGAGLVDRANPTSSRLAGSDSPLAWFGGDMPTDNREPNDDAVTAIQAWLASGAQNN
jgi:hypothetical protein